jgi:hypothetical protein
VLTWCLLYKILKMVIFIKHTLCFIKNPYQLKDKGHTLFFCAFSCQPIRNTLSFTISNLLTLSPFGPPSLLLSLQGNFCYSFEFSMLSLIFLQPHEKIPLSLVCQENLFCQKQSSPLIHFTGYWLCFSSLFTLQLGRIKVNIKSTV